MEPAAALTDPSKIASLFAALEPQARPLDPESDAIAAGLTLPSREDPGQRIVFLVAKRELPPHVEAAREWIRKNDSLLKSIVRGARASVCTGIFPGVGPNQPLRVPLKGSSGPVTVRVVSAVHHLWVDRLGVFDAKGHLDSARRERFLKRLSARWSTEEERQYTDAALDEVDDSQAGAAETRSALLSNTPDLSAGVVSVVYGPGGIGKTFFLRRVTHRMTRAALADSRCGIPVFAELPLLLHTDTLETWLAHQGIRLPIDQIRTLVSYGVIVPVLDALDELVRGQAREGSREFLVQLGKTVAPLGKVLLSSRDYYLNIDRLVREGLADAPGVELTIGYFSKQGRRRYVQARTGFSESVAARWATQLEEQSRQALGDAPAGEVETLIGHPLFLDAFCETVLRIPDNERAAAVREFRITSPDIFGEIVGKVLEREFTEKFQPGWERKFSSHMAEDWQAPFRPELQQAILRELVLLAARDGGREVYRREVDDPRYRELRHGVFTFTTGVPEPEDGQPRTALRELVRSILGDPEVISNVSAEEKETIAAEALDEIASALLQHTLANTSPDLVDDLVFATRSRAYFDYILADCLLEQLREALTAPDPSAGVRFIDWCLAHHIFERQEGAAAEPPFASALDFVLWHRRSLTQALSLLDVLFSREGESDETLASYVLSLGLAVLLRTAADDQYRSVERRNFSLGGGIQLEIFDTIVPVVRRLRLSRCSFPVLRLRDVRVIDALLEDCDFEGLTLSDSSLMSVSMDGIEADSLTFEGRVHLERCSLDVDVSTEKVMVDQSATLVIDGCTLSSPLFDALERASRVRPDAIKIVRCERITEPAPDALTPGRFFLNKLMALSRREGHAEYAVYSYKLRGRTRATGTSFPQAVAVLRSAGVIEVANEMILLTDEAAEHRYSGKNREGMRSYEEVEDYWAPIVAQLDDALK